MLPLADPSQVLIQETLHGTMFFSVEFAVSATLPAVLETHTTELVGEANLGCPGVVVR